MEENFRGSQTFGRKNSKTNLLLQKQDQFISNFESKLKNTLDILQKPSNKENQQTYIEHNSEASKSPISLFDLQDNSNIKEISHFRDTTKDRIVSFLGSDKKANPFNNDQKSNSQEYIHELKSEIENLTYENENLRSEFIKYKTDSFKKYEQLKKNNDELLLSYEEKYKIAVKNLNEQHQNDIRELREEVERLRNEKYILNQNMIAQKEKSHAVIIDLEKEKQEIFSRMNIISLDSKVNSSGDNYKTKYEKVLEEKSNLEKEHKSLLSCYNQLINERSAMSKHKEKESEAISKSEKVNVFIGNNSLLPSLEKDRFTGLNDRSHRSENYQSATYSDEKNKYFGSSRDLGRFNLNISGLKSKDHTMNLEDLKTLVEEVSFRERTSSLQSSRNEIAPKLVPKSQEQIERISKKSAKRPLSSRRETIADKENDSKESNKIKSSSSVQKLSKVDKKKSLPPPPLPYKRTIKEKDMNILTEEKAKKLFNSVNNLKSSSIDKQNYASLTELHAKRKKGKLGEDCSKGVTKFSKSSLSLKENKY